MLNALFSPRHREPSPSRASTPAAAAGCRAACAAGATRLGAARGRLFRCRSWFFPYSSAAGSTYNHGKSRHRNNAGTWARPGTPCHWRQARCLRASSGGWGYQGNIAIDQWRFI